MELCRMKHTEKPEQPSLSDIREATGILSDLKHELGAISRGKRILWVDDHPVNNEIATRVLKQAGLKIYTALSTDEAVSMLDRDAEAFDVIISDMGRPGNAIAGMQLIHVIRKSWENLPIIVYSDNPEAERRRGEIESFGAIGPVVGPKNLLAEIRSLLQ